MQVGEELLKPFYENLCNIRRKNWPDGDHISADGAEGGTIWYYDAENDDLIPDYKMGYHDLAANDWELIK